MAHASHHVVDRGRGSLELQGLGGALFGFHHARHVPAKLAEPVLDLAKGVAARGFRVRSFADRPIGVGQGRGIRFVVVDENAAPSRRSFRERISGVIAASFQRRRHAW